MPSLTLTNEQALELVKQLPADQQDALLEYLIAQRWRVWHDLSQQGQERVRAVAAEHRRDWDTMSEAEREEFIDDLVHEDR